MISNESPFHLLQAFEDRYVTVSLSTLLPSKSLPSGVKSTAKYQQIATSIQELGLVEPPVVSRTSEHLFLILDGHIRVEILKDLGVLEVDCLVSIDDEAFTYNKRISRLSVVQEHAMVVRAIGRGVSENKIGKALNLKINSIRRRAKLLDGICDEAASILKDKQCPMAVFEVLKKMRPIRQIEAAELFINTNNFSVAYASAILAGTPQIQLVEGHKPKSIKGVTPAAMARMERELARLQDSISSIQDVYGREHLQLAVIKAYIAKLLERTCNSLFDPASPFIPARV